MPGLFDLPVGVAPLGGPGSGYRVVVYMPGRAMTITSVSKYQQVIPEIAWVMVNVYGILYTNIFNIKIHRESI